MHFKSPLIKFCRSLSRFYLKKLWLLLSTYGHCTLCWGEFLRHDLRENDVIWQIFVHRHHHNGCFWSFLPKKYLRQISILSTNKWKIRKSKGTIVMPTFKINIRSMPLFFLTFYSLVSEIDICVKFWTKIPKSSHSDH